MAALAIRWSEHEAVKSYARPFAVRFLDGDDLLGAVAVSGADLLYYRQFQLAVLRLSGEFFRDPEIEAGDDPQRAWLDLLSSLLPTAGGGLRLRPTSTFDHEQGRVFHIEITGLDRPAAIPVAAAVDYQEFQAVLAHSAGRLYRDPAVEAVEDPAARQAAWLDCLEGMLERPASEELMAERWPWRTTLPR